MIFGSLKFVLGKENKFTRKLMLVDFCQTREAAEKAGFVLKPYDENKPVKSWIFTDSVIPDEDGFVSFNGLAVAKDKVSPLVKDGKPFMKPFKVPVEDVKEFNIPPKSAGTPDKPVLFEYQVPLDSLKPGEFFDWQFGGSPVVRSSPVTDEPKPVPGAINFDFAAEFEQLNAKLDRIFAVIVK